ncbi:hypothetical protein IMY05_C1655000300 [Salix suchowensis]|nr:hypothetical protein IMY05_C1655000300 [Salix suchowensis]
MPRLDLDLEQKDSLFVFLSLFYKSQELIKFHALFYPNSQGSPITSFLLDLYISQV